MPIDIDELNAVLMSIMTESEKVNVFSAEPVVKAELPAIVVPTVQKPKRCQSGGCIKKLMLSDFACKCSGWYCSSHRHSESHSCTFDYKKSTRDILEKQLNKVESSKVDKI
jgi:hypothetical protein